MALAVAPSSSHLHLLMDMARQRHWQDVVHVLRSDGGTRAAFLLRLENKPGDSDTEFWLANFLLFAIRADSDGDNEGCLQFWRYLLEELKIDLEYRIPAQLSSRTVTLLMKAAAFGFVELFGLLINAGADVNAVDSQGRSVVGWLFCGLVNRAMFEKALLLVECPRLRPAECSDWCTAVVCASEDSWCHLSMCEFREHALACGRWSGVRVAWVSAVVLSTVVGTIPTPNPLHPRRMTNCKKWHQ